MVQAGIPESVYKTAAKVDWSRYLPRGKTFAIDASVGASKLNHRAFVSQKIKDAIVDRLRKARGDRPSVDPKRLDVWIRARLYKDRLSLSWDASGHALHQRGYRREAGEAPLARPSQRRCCSQPDLMAPRGSWTRCVAPVRS